MMGEEVFLFLFSSFFFSFRDGINSLNLYLIYTVLLTRFVMGLHW